MCPMDTISRGTVKPSMGQRRPRRCRRSSRALALAASYWAEASSSLLGVAEKPSLATRSMTSRRTSSSSPGLAQTLALAVARFTLTLSTPSNWPTTRSMREEQAAQCMPPISKPNWQASLLSLVSFSVPIAAPPLVFPAGSA